MLDLRRRQFITSRRGTEPHPPAVLRPREYLGLAWC
jgi:hypothetical protein